MIQIVTAVVSAIAGMILLLVLLPNLLGRVAGWRLNLEEHRGKKVLIWGAGGLGIQILINLISDPEQRASRHVVGFIDDNPNKIGKKIKLDVPFGEGVTLRIGPLAVWGTSAALDEIIEKHKVGEIVRAFYIGDAPRVAKVKQFCTEKGIDWIDETKRLKCQLYYSKPSQAVSHPLSD